MNIYKTHNCSELNLKNKLEKVKLSGWLHRKRDHGNLVFIDLRDHYGITQCVIENKNKYFKLVEKLKPETVITISGTVAPRDKETENLELKTGSIEVKIDEVNVLSESKDFTNAVFGEQNYPEEIRLNTNF